MEPLATGAVGPYGKAQFLLYTSSQRLLMLIVPTASESVVVQSASRLFEKINMLVTPVWKRTVATMFHDCCKGWTLLA